MNLQSYLKKEQAAVDRWLERQVRPMRAPHGLIYTAMRYSLFAGGKRIRPVLALAVNRMLRGSRAAAMAGGCAVELVHTYSLIHDDLPCMDDDDFRRGRPSCHRQFDEATAVLAGDALQALAFQLVAERIPDADVSRAISRELSRACGPEGMVGGQVLDMHFEKRRCTVDQLHDLHRRKTGAMIAAAVRIGALAGNASPARLRALTGFGRTLGLLFQVVDDILDVTGDFRKLGKSVGKDAVSRKSTFPALMGLERTKAYRDTLYARACKGLAIYGSRGTILKELCSFVAFRDH